MKYLIMCGGYSCSWEVPKHLYIFEGKPIVERTIGLLQDNSITDIAITTSPKCVDKYNKFGVEVIPYESNNVPFMWLDAFYPTDEPVCYLYGDVVYSPEAIHQIVNTHVTSIEFFASAPPFAKNYPKKFAEPFAFKVVNQKRFREYIEKTKFYYSKRVWHRHPISWELWQVIRGTQPNVIQTNYSVINDYTCDVDSMEELKAWQNI